jgi:hypothetical protein
MARGSVPTLSNAFPTTSPTSATQMIMPSSEFPSMRTSMRRPSHTMNCWTFLRRIRKMMQLCGDSDILWVIKDLSYGMTRTTMVRDSTCW